ncbi:MAG: sulfotransferase [Kordiimonadaceae bacterium]|nr:sulfotransferase [Kordiimonadaceae bacterium]MBO6569484.1 sulfotransferase [Kordiimonadaceae bacterium]MBO6964959.1 sulfotransferase [Kordiimonadaceae bacterium]
MSYIFVGGAQRSGTSLVAASLCSGEQTNPYLGESSGFRRLLDAQYFMTHRFEDESRFHLGSEKALTDYMRTVTRMYLDRTLRNYAPATSLVLKEPHMTSFFPFLHKMLPEAKFVVVARDPRDTIASMMKVGEKMQEIGTHHMFNSADVDKLAELVNAFYEVSIKAVQSSDSFRSALRWVKYEDFVSFPLEVVSALRQFTGLKLEQFDPNYPTKRTLAAKLASRAQSERAKPWQSKLMSQKEISTSSIGAYKQQLSAKQIEFIENKLAPVLQMFGYEKTSI